MKTAISIPNQIFEEAERAAKRLGISRSELYSRAVAEFLDLRAAESVTEALDRVYADASEPLDDAVTEAQLEAIGEEPW